MWEARDILEIRALKLSHYASQCSYSLLARPLRIHTMAVTHIPASISSLIDCSAQASSFPTSNLECKSAAASSAAAVHCCHKKAQAHFKFPAPSFSLHHHPMSSLELFAC